MTYTYSRVANRIEGSEIRALIKYRSRPGMLYFGGGSPDSLSFPVEEVANITNTVLTEKGCKALQYGPTAGEKDCKQELIAFMKRNGDQIREEEMIITSSSQQSIDLLSLLFLDENSIIFIESPSYLGAIQTFRRSGALVRGIEVDEDGMKIDLLEKELERLAKENKSARFIYTIPDFQNPSGITMSKERRLWLIEVAKKYNIPIIEDSPYRELSFKEELTPSIWSLAQGKGVFMLKTLSKMLFPGMRMGWLCCPSESIEKVTMLKQSVDLCTPSFTQFIVAEFFKQGKMEESIAKAINCYKPKCEAMLESLQQYMPAEVSWSKPTGGMFLWVILPHNLDARDVFTKAIENDVAFVIGEPFHCDGRGKNTLRLNYSYPKIEEIKLGIKRLAEIIRGYMERYKM